jgi:hypothetical protein
MPFVTSDDIRTEQAKVAARAARLQAAFDHATAIADDEAEHGFLSAASDHYLDGLRGTLTTSLQVVSDRARTLEGLLDAALSEETVCAAAE